MLPSFALAFVPSPVGPQVDVFRDASHAQMLLARSPHDNARGGALAQRQQAADGLRSRRGGGITGGRVPAISPAGAFLCPEVLSLTCL